MADEIQELSKYLSTFTKKLWQLKAWLVYVVTLSLSMIEVLSFHILIKHIPTSIIFSYYLDIYNLSYLSTLYGVYMWVRDDTWEMINEFPHAKSNETRSNTKIKTIVITYIGKSTDDSICAVRKCKTAISQELTWIKECYFTGINLN